MHVINGNYGNHTIAVMQWAHEQALMDVCVVSVNTGWQAGNWQIRVEQGEALANAYGFKVLRLQGFPSYQTLMRDRNEFPSVKFQWCAGFLKGLPLIDWLDERDPSCEATVLLGKRKQDSRANAQLAEFITASEHYGNRKVWHPLYNHNEAEFLGLIKRAKLDVLEHRSLECDPCIHNCNNDFLRLEADDIKKTAQLELELGKSLFIQPIQAMIALIKKETGTTSPKPNELFDMGCGSPFACGE